MTGFWGLDGDGRQGRTRGLLGVTETLYNWMWSWMRSSNFFLNFNWVHRYPPKDLSQALLQLGGDTALSPVTSKDDVCHFVPVPLGGKGWSLSFLSPIGRETGRALTTPCMMEAACEESRAVLLALDLSTLDHI